MKKKIKKVSGKEKKTARNNHSWKENDPKERRTPNLK